MTYDFSGWATRNDLRCTDGRVIRHNAFADNDGKEVPLVWNHQHNNPENVLGHAVLENRDEGVYAFCSFNDTETGQIAKELVHNRDVSSLSIYANQLKQQGPDVLHGNIREVSLVLAGANPGAYIDSIMCHGDDDPSQAIIYTGEELELMHSDDDKEKEKQEMANEKKTPEVDEEETKGRTVQDVFDEMTDEQKNVVYALVAEAANSANSDEDDEEGEEPEEEDDDMKHNVFDNDVQETTLSHGDIEAVFTDARRYGSLKESALQHGIEDVNALMHADPIYGIDGIETLFPDNKNLTKTPGFIKRRTEWVDQLMNKVGHTPFSRTKSLLANITMDEARAKGYIKGKEKTSEQFALLKRVTSPTTIYKKQKLDRDDILDITDFDVVAWVKAEMRLMLDEEIARAVLIGDGRAAGTDDKIDENCLRPIWAEVDNTATYANGVSITPWADLAFVATDSVATDAIKAKEFIRTCIKSRKEYRGSGTPILFTTEDMLTDMLLLEDLNGRIIYDTMDKLCTALRVSSIVTVPVMENKTASRTIDGDTYTTTLTGIIVNPADYTIGADKGGSISMFDDFDIDFNQQKYLMETRISGALTIPHSAIIVESYTTV